MKPWFRLLIILPNCNCFDWSFPCQVAVPGCTFLESCSQNTYTISRNDARKKYVFLPMSLKFLKSVLRNVPVLLNLGKEKWKYSRGWVGKKRYAFGDFFATSVKVQIKTLKFYGLKTPNHPQVSQRP